MYLLSLRKRLEKQTKIIEGQGEKQVKGIEEPENNQLSLMRLLKKICKSLPPPQSLPLDKQKEIFYRLVTGRMQTIEKLHNSINFNNLTYHYMGPIASVSFDYFIDETTLFNMTKSKRVKLADVEKI